jgi:hypothetical protein
VEAIDARRKDLPDNDPDAIGWGTALLVGLAQVLAGVFPGTSRSAAAIFAALLFGRSNRVAATEFAFLVGIPTMFAATGYELLHTLKDGGAAGEDWSALAVAFVVSAITAFIVVKWLLRYIQTHRFTVFAWYRIVLGAALLAWLHSGTAAPVGEGAGRADVLPAAVSPPDLAFSSSSRTQPRVDGTHAGARFIELPSAPIGQELASPASSEGVADIARFRAAKLCVQAEMFGSMIDQSTVETFIAPEGTPGITDEDRQTEIAEASRVLDLVDQAKEDCKTPIDDLLDGGMYDVALRAAQAGDEQAASCFVGGGFPMPDSLWRQAEVRARFRRQSIPLLERGIRRGDWSMVVLASLSVTVRSKPQRGHYIAPTPSYRPAFSLVLDAFSQGDAERAYALNVLKELGTPDRYKGSNDGYLVKVAGQLDQAQRLRAETWAKDAFARYFHGEKWNAEKREPCLVGNA